MTITAFLTIAALTAPAWGQDAQNVASLEINYTSLKEDLRLPMENLRTSLSLAAPSGEDEAAPDWSDVGIDPTKVMVEPGSKDNPTANIEEVTRIFTTKEKE